MPSNAEIVAGFMEPKPTEDPAMCGPISALGWWRNRKSECAILLEWLPSGKTDDLNMLREVEARLTDEQAAKYDRKIVAVVARDNLAQRDQYPLTMAQTSVWHASADQKLEALARVLESR